MRANWPLNDFDDTYSVSDAAGLNESMLSGSIMYKSQAGGGLPFYEHNKTL